MYIVTGGAGFIGSALIHELNRRGISDIIIVDHLGQSEKWRNLRKLAYVDYMRRDHFMELVRADALPWKIEGIAHLGACSSTTEQDADFLMENNFHYSRDLCGYAMDKGIRFVNASSAATYGRGEHGFQDGADSLRHLQPLNMYGYSKHMFDLWLLREGLVDYVASLKFFNVYGPNEYHKGAMQSVAVKLFHEIRVTGTATLFASSTPELADGEQKRDFVYVKDCAAMLAWLLERPAVNGILNVGSGVASTFNQLAQAVFLAMGLPCSIKYTPMPESLARNYQNYTCADMGWMARKDCNLNFRTLDAGIEDYICKYLASKDMYL